MAESSINVCTIRGKIKEETSIFSNSQILPSAFTNQTNSHGNFKYDASLRLVKVFTLIWFQIRAFLIDDIKII